MLCSRGTPRATWAALHAVVLVGLKGRQRFVLVNAEDEDSAVQPDPNHLGYHGLVPGRNCR